jgi:hypothetical protein
MDHIRITKVRIGNLIRNHQTSKHIKLGVLVIIPVDVDPKKVSRNLQITTKKLWVEALALRDDIVLKMKQVNTESKKSKTKKSKKDQKFCPDLYKETAIFVATQQMDIKRVQVLVKVIRRNNATKSTLKTIKDCWCCVLSFISHLIFSIYNSEFSTSNLKYG